jgi:hypothetical protein
MGSDRRMFFNQVVNVGALSGLAAMLPSDAFAKVESSVGRRRKPERRFTPVTMPPFITSSTLTRSSSIQTLNIRPRTTSAIRVLFACPSLGASVPSL